MHAAIFEVREEPLAKSQYWDCTTLRALVQRAVEVVKACQLENPDSRFGAWLVAAGPQVLLTANMNPVVLGEDASFYRLVARELSARVGAKLVVHFGGFRAKKVDQMAVAICEVLGIPDSAIPAADEVEGVNFLAESESGEKLSAWVFVEADKDGKVVRLHETDNVPIDAALFDWKAGVFAQEEEERK